MAYEIERKFLIKDQSWRASAGRPVSIRQVYLARTGSMSLRVRIKDNRSATLTIKSAAAEIRRLEFEYEIPLSDAEALFDLREGEPVAKLRFELPAQGSVWEIDVFEGENQGLVIAEIELPDENVLFEKPSWLGQEITADPRYSNAALAAKPFGKW
jgi:adenylate cyclase